MWTDWWYSPIQKILVNWNNHPKWWVEKGYIYIIIIQIIYLVLLYIICQQNCYKLPILCPTEVAGIKLPCQLMWVWFPVPEKMECTSIQFTGCLHGSSEIPCKHLCFQLASTYIYICTLFCNYTSSLFINFAKKQHRLIYGYLRYMTWTKVFTVQCRPRAGAQPSCSWKDISMRGHASWCNAEVSIPRWRERIDTIHFRGIQHESKFWDIPKLLIY